MLKSRTEKGLHIPFIFFLISILPQLYLKDHPTWSSSFQDISFSTVPTPPSSFVYLGTQRVEASFRSCIPVTNSHFCCSYPLYIPIETPAHCQLKRLCEYIPILFWLCLQELDWIPVVRIPAFVLPVPVPEREWPFRRWVFMNTLSPGTDWCCRRCWESQLADCNFTAISTNFICKTESKPRHSSNTIYKENSLSPGRATSRANITLIFGISIHYFDWDSNHHSGDHRVSTYTYLYPPQWFTVNQQVEPWRGLPRLSKDPQDGAMFLYVLT